MKNSACQPTPAINRPPSEGPSAVPMADTVPSRPMALPVLSWGTVCATKAIVSTIITAAPSPCSARAAISSPSVGAMPHNTDASVNSAIPASSSRRRPTMSPSRPALTTRVVVASR